MSETSLATTRVDVQMPASDALAPTQRQQPIADRFRRTQHQDRARCTVAPL